MDKINALKLINEIKVLKIGLAAVLDARRIAEEAIEAGEVPKKHISRLRNELFNAVTTLSVMIKERENKEEE
jgi:hypothetical protein